MRWALGRWARLRALDFAELLNLSGPYRVREILVDEEDWVEGSRLEDLELFDEGITVLGVHRHDGTYVGVPRGETRLEAGDRLVLYGRKESLSELDDRRKGPGGDEAHERGRREQAEERDRQRRTAAEREAR